MGGIHATEDEEEYEEKPVVAECRAGTLLLRKEVAVDMDSGAAQKLLSLQIVVVARPIKVGQEVLMAVRAGAYDPTELGQATPGWADCGRETIGEGRSRLEWRDVGVVFVFAVIVVVDDDELEVEVLWELAQ